MLPWIILSLLAMILIVTYEKPNPSRRERERLIRAAMNYQNARLRDWGKFDQGGVD